MNNEDAIAALGHVPREQWFVSSYTGNGENCVKVTTQVPTYVGVRDSKLGDDSPVLAIPARSWQAFLGIFTPERASH